MLHASNCSAEAKKFDISFSFSLDLDRTLAFQSNRNLRKFEAEVITVRLMGFVQNHVVDDGRFHTSPSELSYCFIFMARFPSGTNEYLAIRSWDNIRSHLPHFPFSQTGFQKISARQDLKTRDFPRWEPIFCTEHRALILAPFFGRTWIGLAILLKKSVADSGY